MSSCKHTCVLRKKRFSLFSFFCQDYILKLKLIVNVIVGNVRKTPLSFFFTSKYYWKLFEIILLNYTSSLPPDLIFLINLVISLLMLWLYSTCGYERPEVSITLYVYIEVLSYLPFRRITVSILIRNVHEWNRLLHGTTHWFFIAIEKLIASIFCHHLYIYEMSMKKSDLGICNNCFLQFTRVQCCILIPLS